MAAACGLARRSIGPLRETEYGRLLLQRAAGEVIAVAQASGIPIRDDEPDRIVRAFDGLNAAAKPSFLLDLERGPNAPTELDLLSGTVARLGRQVQVPTPVHDTVVGALG
jgi:2-dehydropantoate 2-reductase